MSKSDKPSKPGLIQTGKERFATERERTVERIDEARKRSGLVDALARAWEHDTAVGGGLMACALAFRLFLFMVPFVLVVVTALGESTRVAQASPSTLASKAGISGVLAKSVVSTGDMSHSGRLALLAVGSYALFSTAKSLVTTLVASHCLIWRVPKPAMKKAKAALTFIAFITITLASSAYLGKLRHAAPAPGFFLTLASIALPLVAWWWASYRLPHDDVPVWALLPGALIFAVGIEALHLFSVYYSGARAASKSQTYGAAGIALMVLAWAYVAGRLVTFTALVNATLWRRFAEREWPDGVRPEHPPKGPRSVSTLVDWIRSAVGLLR